MAAAGPTHAVASGSPAASASAPAAAPAASAAPPNRPLDVAAAGFAGTLEPGTCVAFAPTAGDRHQVVFLDAGHGGIDPGAVGTAAGGTPVQEKDVTLAVAKAAAVALEADGYTVVLSRLADETVAAMPPADVAAGLMSVEDIREDIAARVACANAAQAAVLVSLHMNGSTDPGTNGTLSIYSDGRPFSGESARLAQSVQEAVIGRLHSAELGTPNLGTTADSQVDAPALSPLDATYGHYLELGPAYPGLVTDPSRMPGVLCEILFVTNPSEAALASGAQGQALLAAGVATGVERYLEQA